MPSSLVFRERHVRSVWARGGGDAVGKKEGGKEGKLGKEREKKGRAGRTEVPRKQPPQTEHFRKAD